MRKEKVKGILGEPGSVEAIGSLEIWRWGVANVTFRNDRVDGWREP